jgi:hypothetical protein
MAIQSSIGFHPRMLITRPTHVGKRLGQGSERSRQFSRSSMWRLLQEPQSFLSGEVCARRYH